MHRPRNWKTSELELWCKLQVIDIIAAATLSLQLMYPCTMRQTKALQRMSDMCIDSGEINPIVGTLKEEVEVG
jgi:hypothetical protein